MYSFGSLVKRGWDRHCLHRLVADHYVDGPSGFRRRRGQITESDVLVQGRRRTAAGHPARGRAVQVYFIAIPANASAAHFKTSQLAFDAFSLLPGQRLSPDERALVHFDDPGEIGLERRDGRVDFVAVERHLRLETQRVASAQAAGLDA